MTDPRTIPARAVVLAGGKGSRLNPYTTVIPKPLLPLGDRAILDLVVRQLRYHGFTQLTFAVGYLAHLINAVFGDGEQHGVSIDYHEESEPLGTAGALASIDDLDAPFLVMNGDVLTTLDYRELYDAHVKSGNVLTIASHRRVVKTDYGVLKLDGHGPVTRNVNGYVEKPEIPYTVSMGIYILSPEAMRFVVQGERLDMPDLILKLIDAGAPVGSYHYDGYWLDIGRHEDFQRAMEDFQHLASEPAWDRRLVPRDPDLQEGEAVRPSEHDDAHVLRAARFEAGRAPASAPN